MGRWPSLISICLSFLASFALRSDALRAEVHDPRTNTTAPVTIKDEFLKTPFGTDWADQCPEVKGSAARWPESDNELRILTWNLEWAFSPRSKRVKWMQEIVEPNHGPAVRCPADLFTEKGEKPFRNGPCKSVRNLEEHLAEVSDFLGKLNPRPHLMNFVELDGCQVLRDIAKSLPGYEPYLVYGNDDRTTQQVGLLSNIQPSAPLERFATEASTPVTDNGRCHVDVGTVSLSKHYVAKFSLPVSGNSINLYMIGVHLKSMRQENEGEACSHREAEAKILDGILQELHVKDPTAEFVILGDFNDFDPEVKDRRGARYFNDHGKEFPVGKYQVCQKDESGASVKKPVKDEGSEGQASRVFQIIKGDGTTRPQLVNVLQNVERTRRYSHKGSYFSPFTSYCGNGKSFECGEEKWTLYSRLTKEMDARDCPGDSLLDYILVSPRLASAMKSINILNDADYENAYEADDDGTMKYVQGTRSKHFNGNKLGADRRNKQFEGYNPSDHFPVLLTIDLSKLEGGR